jgi:hypothetical protein
MSTIRQQLAGYAKMARLTLIGGVAAIMVSDIVMLHMGVPRDMRRHWLLAVTFLACIPGVFVSFRMRCPRCKFNLFSLPANAPQVSSVQDAAETIWGGRSLLPVLWGELR